MLPRTETTHSNRWRRSYPPPDGVTSIGTAGVEWLGGGDPKKRKQTRAERRAAQHELFMRTGFAGGNAELGHRVAYECRARGYSETVAQVAGHLAAVAGNFNFQGNYRIAQLLRRSVRTVQRARAFLEMMGLIKSCLLEAGQMVDGMKAPTLHAQVIRDVRALHRLAMVRSNRQPHTRSKKKHSNAGARAAVAVVAPELQEAGVTAEVLDEIAREVAPDFLQGIIAGAAAGKRELDAKRENKPSALDAQPPAPPPVRRRSWTAQEIDEALEQQPRTEVREPDKPALH